MSDRMDINRLVLEMRSIRNQVDAFQTVGSLSNKDRQLTARTDEANTLPFGELLSQAVDKVNSIQHNSGDLSRAYIKGDPSVDITDVMVASQKSSVAFQAVTQVRNKVVEAYKDVMNMPI